MTRSIWQLKWAFKDCRTLQSSPGAKVCNKPRSGLPARRLRYFVWVFYSFRALLNVTAENGELFPVPLNVHKTERFHPAGYAHQRSAGNGHEANMPVAFFFLCD